MGILASMAGVSPAVVRLVRGVQSRGMATSASGWKTYGLSPVRTNQPVEKYAAWREDIENSFRANRMTAVRLAIFGLAGPTLIYQMCRGEFENLRKHMVTRLQGPPQLGGTKRSTCRSRVRQPSIDTHQ